MTYKYLASPYTHPDKAVMQARFEEAERCLAWLLNLKIWAYAPIVHCHALARKYELPPSHDFWLDYDRAMILGSNGVLVLQIDGGKESKGVQSELLFARANHIFIRSVRPVGDTFVLENFGCPTANP
jgi:hypothetical protein